VRDLLGHRTVRFVLAVAILWGGWTVFLEVTAAGRIDAALREALARERLVDVAVTLGFAPEDFHLRLFQEYGVVSGVEATTVRLNRVRPADVQRIARYYWVRRIAPR
jgi:hypothetical protein